LVGVPSGGHGKAVLNPGFMKAKKEGAKSNSNKHTRSVSRKKENREEGKMEKEGGANYA